MTNAEKVAQHIAQHGSAGILVHSVPGTRFWLVCQIVPKKSPHWKVVLCDPNQTTWRLVSDKVSDEDHIRLWNELLTEQLKTLWDMHPSN